MILTITPNPAVDRVYFVDNLRIGEVNRPADTSFTAGGKGLNVARVANIIGSSVAASGFLGGYNGEFIRSEIKKLGIADAFLSIDKDTRICINITDRSTGESTELLEPGPKLEIAEYERFYEHLKKLAPLYDVVTISGSTPAGAPEDFYSKCVRIINEAEKTAIADTSGKSFTAALKEKPFMVKPNQYELASYLGQEITNDKQCADALMSLAEAGVTLPAVSLGKDGCMALCDGRLLRFYSPKVSVVNTVGSGDSFIAGTAAGLDRGMSQKDALKLAMACGTANTQFMATGTVTRDLVESYYKQIEVKEL